MTDRPDESYFPWFRNLWVVATISMLNMTEKKFAERRRNHGTMHGICGRNFHSGLLQMYETEGFDFVGGYFRFLQQATTRPLDRHVT